MRIACALLGLVVTLGLGCSPESDGEEDGGDGSGSGDGSDGADTGDGATEGEVDCASLGAGEPTVGPGPVGPLGYPTRHCNPRASGEGEFKCCSDDPAAPNGVLPDYLGKTTNGETPIFSGESNERGTSGMCVRTDDIPAGAELLDPGAENCPTPCNPLWDAGSTATVCGEGRVCCQTRAMGEKDCVVDPDSGMWRPVTGKDYAPDGSGLTFWTPQEHATHQDPGLQGCTQFALGDQAVYTDCIDQLTVANQRGYCMSLAPGELCPAAEPDYIDACEQLNGE